MKKIILASLAVTALVSSANAASFNGFYAGASVGVAQAKNKTTTTTSLGGETAANVLKAGTYALGSAAFAGTLFVGYGQTLANNIYLGGELFGTLATGSDTTTVGATVLKEQAAASFGGAVRLGYVVTPQSLVFLSLGLASEGTKFTYTNGTAGTTKSSTKRKIAFVPGIGFELALADNLALRGDMTYSFGGKLDPSTDLSFTAGQFTSQARTLGIKLGVAYRF